MADLQSVLDLVINFERKSREYVLKDDRTRIEDVVRREYEQWMTHDAGDEFVGDPDDHI